jgi:protein-tyrosine phosphatase
MIIMSREKEDAPAPLQASETLAQHSKRHRQQLLLPSRGPFYNAWGAKLRLKVGQMIDIHSHILPGLDDGSKSWEMTLAMCRQATQDGITQMVATPHASETYRYDRHRVEEGILELNRRIEPQITFSIGCDFHLSYDNIEDAIAYPQRYTIAAKEYLLVELSDYGIPGNIGDSFFRLQSAGMTPIVTHPERNAILQRTPGQVLEWVMAGYLVQVTASAVTGQWGNIARKVAFWLLEHNAVHVLATDAHDDKYRKPILSEARNMVAKRFGEDLARRLVQENPAAIIAGKPIPF